jgi:hypothetical protein
MASSTSFLPPDSRRASRHTTSRAPGGDPWTSRTWRQVLTGWVADDEGHAVASGVYYVKLQIGRRSVTTRMVQLK